ncbi:hypothetical protein [Moorena producens]|uniref:hypothetical protein n=1 Tax=Moorena producens TaxID=1155739 RepID=UPI001313F89C|nr:hypothetical protein [Moorena producens]
MRSLIQNLIEYLLPMRFDMRFIRFDIQGKRILFLKSRRGEDFSDRVLFGIN